MKTQVQKQRDGSPWGTVILCLIILGVLLLAAVLGCSRETTTGIEYKNKLNAPVKVEIYQKQEHDLTLLETRYAKPFEIFLVELPAGEIKTEYTPAGCWRVLPEIITLEEGEVVKDSLWFALPLWN
jgi:hypothetical protein